LVLLVVKEPVLLKVASAWPIQLLMVFRILVVLVISLVLLKVLLHQFSLLLLVVVVAEEEEVALIHLQVQALIPELFNLPHQATNLIKLQRMQQHQLLLVHQCNQGKINLLAHLLKILLAHLKVVVKEDVVLENAAEMILDQQVMAVLAQQTLLTVMDGTEHKAAIRMQDTDTEFFVKYPCT
jgi:hypothetical protein